MTTIAKREDVNPKEGEAEYGDVAFADEKNKKYPIDSEEHVRAAWNYINKPGNAGKYDAEEVKTIKGRIVAAWKKMIDKEGPPAAMSADLVLDAFVQTRAGEAYRILPFGEIKRNGKTRTITAEMAGQFRLPHFHPPIKLGSHDEAAPAGGSISRLEVREDGLYAVPELTDKGNQAISEGHYRYHSPEIIWEGGGIEDANTGEMIPGPLIVGDALLHTPALGERAAMYQTQIILKENDMAENENISMPVKVWDTLTAFLHPAKEEKPEPVKEENEKPDQLKAVQTELEKYKSKVEAMEAEQVRKARVETYSAQLRETLVADGATVLAGMTDEQANWVVQNFKALSNQVRVSALFGEIGSAGAGGADDPASSFDRLVNEEMAKKSVDYAAAAKTVAQAHPDIYVAYRQGGK